MRYGRPVSIVVVATVFPAPEFRQQAIALLEKTIPLVHAENGCELYALHEDDGRLVMVEKWASRAALDAHLNGPAFTAMRGRLQPLASRPAEVQVLQPHPVGTPGQGSV